MHVSVALAVSNGLRICCLVIPFFHCQNLCNAVPHICHVWRAGLPLHCRLESFPCSSCPCRAQKLAVSLQCPQLEMTLQSGMFSSSFLSTTSAIAPSLSLRSGLRSCHLITQSKAADTHFPPLVLKAFINSSPFTIGSS